MRAPLFITGLPRTGTSILHELLAQDPAHRAPLHWEVRHPCPAPEAASFETDPRIALAEDELQLWNQVVPEYVAMHELGAQLPVECIQITAHEFRSDELIGRHLVPSYAAWLAQRRSRARLRLPSPLPPAPAIALPARALGAEGAVAPGRRWPQLFAEYPDARVVVTHRDPLKVLPSVASILYSTAWVRSDAVDAQAVLGWFTPETCRALLDAMSALRDAGALPASSGVRRALRRPDGAAARDARRASTTTSGCRCAQRPRRACAPISPASPRHKHGAHRYAFENTGRDARRERERFRGYQERYGVASEA